MKCPKCKREEIRVLWGPWRKCSRCGHTWRLAVKTKVTTVKLNAVLALLSLALLGCPAPADDDSATLETAVLDGQDVEVDGCAWGSEVMPGPGLCEVPWPGTVDVYFYQSIAPVLDVPEGAVVLIRREGAESWSESLVSRAEDCAAVPYDETGTVSQSVPEVAVINGLTYIRANPGGPAIVELLVSLCL